MSISALEASLKSLTLAKNDKDMMINYLSSLASNRPGNVFRLRNNQIIIKDCKSNGSLLNLNLSVEKCPWILLNLKIFSIQDMSYPVWICTSCEQGKTLSTMHSIQDPQHLKGILCHHSKVVYELYLDWELYSEDDDNAEDDPQVIILQDREIKSKKHLLVGMGVKKEKGTTIRVYFGVTNLYN